MNAINLEHEVKKYREMARSKAILCGSSIDRYNALRQRYSIAREKGIRERELFDGKGNESVNDESLCPVC